MKGRRDFVLAAGLGMLITVATVSAAGAAPSIANLSPRGLTTGATTRIAIAGGDLASGVKLLLPVPIARQEILPGGNAKQVTIAVTLDASTPAGIYPLRLAGGTGISEAAAVCVDKLPQTAFVSEVEQLPVALHGNLAGATVLRTSFAGKRGQRIVAEVEGRRLGSALNPVLRLSDRRGVQLAWCQATGSMRGDARVDVVLPEDGKYTVELHDALYAGPAPGFFRLKIGELHYADFVLPLAVSRGGQTPLRYVGPGVDRALRVPFDAAMISDRAAVPWPIKAAYSGRRPEVRISDLSEVVESDSGATKQEVSAIPVGISGILTTAGEEDSYRLPVVPGAKLRFDVLAGRIGSSLDGVLTIRNEKGQTLARNDDRGNMIDPGIDFTVPAGTKAILVGISDLAGRGGADFVYRISVTEASRPDFQLSVAADRYLVPHGGAVLMRVEAQRRGYGGPIQLEFSGLPKGVSAAGTSIPAGATQALVSLTAPDSEPDYAIASLNGKGGDDKTPLARAVKVQDATQSWQRNQLAMAVVPRGPIALVCSEPASDAPLYIGSRQVAKIRLERDKNAQGQVRLSLVTSQVIPQRKVKQNNKDVMVDDLSRALRLEGMPMIAADANQAEAAILLPADLAARPYDLAIRGELLAGDGKKVLATAYSPALRFNVAVRPPAQPLALWEDQPELAAQLNDGKGEVSLDADEKHFGSSSLKVTGEGRRAGQVSDWNFKIREFPGPGEYRYLRFAWKKQGGKAVCLEIGHDGKFGPDKSQPASYRYHAGPAENCFGASLVVDKKLPAKWVVVTRDLFGDFGEFTLTGIGIAAVDGEHAQFDHLYLGRNAGDFNLVKPAAP